MGLDVVASTGAAQVKLHENPTGAPDVQRLRGAADGLVARLFYATAFTPTAIAEGDRLSIALFQFSRTGDVQGANSVAWELTSSQAPRWRGPERGPLGQLTRRGRQERVVAWAQKVQEATRDPISNRKRKGARQLAARTEALQLIVRGYEELENSDNPLFKKRRQDRALAEAEKSIRNAARLLGIWLT